MMRRALILLITGLTLLLSCSGGNSFRDLLRRVQQAPAENKEALIRAFLRKHKRLPLIADTTVVFIFRSTGTQQPFLTGDMADWKADSLPMRAINGTTYWYKECTFPADARVEYKFVAAGKYLLDPLNTITSEGGFGANSVVLMPEYVFPRELLFQQQNAVSVLDTLRFTSKKRGIRRTLYMYRHPGAGAESPLLLFNDGADYLNFGRAQIILDNLIAAGTIPAVNALFVTPHNRMKEYWLNTEYLDMIFAELLPFVRTRYALETEAPFFMGGVSLGGEISLLALKDHQGRLAGVFSQSGALWIEKNRLLDELAGLSSIQPKIYLDYGTLENQENTHGRLQQILMEKKARFQLNRWHEGHNWGNWRGHLKKALQYLLTREGNQ